MDLLEEIAAEAKRPGTTCAVMTTRALLEEADAAAFDRALDDPVRYPASAIARALHQPPRNLEIREASITRHRRRDCSCR